MADASLKERLQGLSGPAFNEVVANAYRSGRLHDDATLSDAIAQAYARGIEDAVRVAEQIRRYSNQDHIQHCKEVEDAIRALKPKPQTLDTVDTGESR